MFLKVQTNDGDMVAINVAHVTHLTIAAFSGAGSKIHFSSKDSLSVRDTMDDLIARMSETAPA